MRTGIASFFIAKCNLWNTLVHCYLAHPTCHAFALMNQILVLPTHTINSCWQHRVSCKTQTMQCFPGFQSWSAWTPCYHSSTHPVHSIPLFAQKHIKWFPGYQSWNASTPCCSGCSERSVNTLWKGAIYQFCWHIVEKGPFDYSANILWILM